MAGVVSTRDPSAGTLSEPNMPFLVPTQLAATGSVIANAAAISASAGLVVVTGADGTKGVQLPAPAPGKVVAVYSPTATNAVPVYPPVNGTINSGSANSSLSMAAQTLTIFVGTSTANWASAS